MRSFLKKRKADKIKKLKTRVVELEDENHNMRRIIFQYKLKSGEVKVPTRRPIMKVMGNHGTQSAGPE